MLIAETMKGCVALAIITLAAASVAVQAVPTVQEELAAVKRSTPDLDRGAQLFETCAACHGPDAGGTADGQVPRIGAQHVSVLWKQLVDYRHDRRWDLRMEHFADRHHLEDAQAIADVTAYIHQPSIRSSVAAAMGPPHRAMQRMPYQGSAVSITSTCDGSSMMPWMAADRTSRWRTSIY